LPFVLSFGDDDDDDDDAADDNQYLKENDVFHGFLITFLVDTLWPF